MQPLDVTIDEHTVLALYTDETYATRSVLLCRQSNPPARPADEALAPPTPIERYVMIDQVPLSLVVSVPRALDADALCRFMLASFCWVHFSEEKVREADAQYSACPDARNIVPLMREIEGHCQEDYALYQERARRARWDDAYTVEGDDALQQMPNVLFLRDVRAFQARGADFKQETQLRLTLDNHRVLLHFVRRFRRPITVQGVPYQVRLMDPLLNKHTLWHASEPPEHYVERQLNQRENPAFVQALRFARATPVACGLLWPGLFPLNYTHALLHGDDVVHQMRALSRQDLAFGGKYRAQLAYNKFLIDVAGEYAALALQRVHYGERQTRLGYVALPAHLIKKPKEAEPPKEVKRKRDERTLDGFFARKQAKTESVTL